MGDNGENDVLVVGPTATARQEHASLARSGGEVRTVEYAALCAIERHLLLTEAQRTLWAS